MHFQHLCFWKVQVPQMLTLFYSNVWKLIYCKQFMHILLYIFTLLFFCTFRCRFCWLEHLRTMSDSMHAGLNSQYKKFNRHIKNVKKLHRDTFNAIKDVISSENLTDGKCNYLSHLLGVVGMGYIIIHLFVHLLEQ